MNSYAKISVIIPCYNSERFLTAALESIAWQTYEQWECIIIDDGSTDRSKEIIRSYCSKDSRFRMIEQQNSGPSVARNKGIDAATGTYIQFLDADDILPKERFEKCLQKYQQHKHCDIVYTEYMTYQSGQGFSRVVPAKFPDGDLFAAMVLDHNRSFVATIHEFLFTASIMKTYKFDETLPPYCEDVECWIRIAESGVSFVYLDEVLAIYRFAGTSLSSQEIAVNTAKLFLLDRYREHPKIKAVQERYTQAYAYFSERLVIAYFMKKSFRDGLRAMSQQWGKSSLRGKAKMAGWCFIMMFMSKESFASLRATLVSRTPIKWGGWKQFKEWQASSELVRLLETGAPT